MSNVIRTFRSKPFVTIERNTNDVLGSSGNKASASALGASKAGENGYRVIDLGDIAGFDESAAQANDLAAAYVSGFALGLTVADIAAHYRERMDPRAIYSDHGKRVTAADARQIVADSLRETLGKLSRVAASKQVATWILEGATG